MNVPVPVFAVIVVWIVFYIVQSEVQHYYQRKKIRYWKEKAQRYGRRLDMGRVRQTDRRASGHQRPQRRRTS